MKKFKILLHQLSFHTHLVKCWKDVERSYPSFICKNNWGGTTCCAVVSTLHFVQGDMGKNLFFSESFKVFG